MRFKVGDKVRIVKNNEDSWNSDGLMDGYIGTIMTINTVCLSCYRMKEDRGKWMWIEDMLEQVDSVKCLESRGEEEMELLEKKKEYDQIMKPYFDKKRYNIDKAWSEEKESIKDKCFAKTEENLLKEKLMDLYPDIIVDQVKILINGSRFLPNEGKDLCLADVEKEERLRALNREEEELYSLYLMCNHTREFREQLELNGIYSNGSFIVDENKE